MGGKKMKRIWFVWLPIAASLGILSVGIYSARRRKGRYGR